MTHAGYEFKKLVNFHVLVLQAHSPIRECGAFPGGIAHITVMVGLVELFDITQITVDLDSSTGGQSHGEFDRLGLCVEIA